MKDCDIFLEVVGMLILLQRLAWRDRNWIFVLQRGEVRYL
jgi:hypothetical protein